MFAVNFYASCFVSRGNSNGKKVIRLDWEKAVYRLLFMLANTLVGVYQKMENLMWRYKLLFLKCCTLYKSVTFWSANVRVWKYLKFFQKLFFSWNKSFSFALRLTSRSRTWPLTFHVRKKGEVRSTINILTYVMPLVSLYTPWKRQKTIGFLVFLGPMERDQWYGRE